MTTVYVTDEDGKTMRVKQIHKGRLVPPSFAASGTERMPETKMRPDDIVVCSYPKAGCHWLWENIRMILKGEIILDADEKDEFHMDQHEFGLCDDKPSPRVLNNHSYFDDQPTELINGTGKLIILYRNPKDTVTSFYHHIFNSARLAYEGKFSAFLKLFVQGQVPYNYFEYMQSWQEGLKAHPKLRCLLIRYEDLIKDPITERKRIATYLGKECNDSFLQKVADITSIDRMKERKETIKGKDGSLMMYRKGKIGDWKNHFTVSENEWYDSQLKERLGCLQSFDFVYE